jgi:fructosamine-3-kinase
MLERVNILLAGHTPEPALLHGDLWSGNVGFLDNGSPVIYDPASYYGDRETDLAFSEFFGGFPDSFYRAYEMESPLPPGYAQRKTLYNLYHVLNHTNLFGGGYAVQAERMIECLLS